MCIDLSQMNQVLAVHEADLDAVVQAGVTRKQLNEYIKHTGLFFPVDPGADATLGGMAATRASGTNAVRYGTMRENVLSLKVVLADGRDHSNLEPREEVRRGLRPDAPLRRLGGHARHHHRGHGAPVPGAGSDVGRGMRLRLGRRLHQHRDPDHPVRHPDRALRHRLREDGRRDQQVQEDQLPRRADGVLRVPRLEGDSVVEQAEAVQAIAKEHGGKDFVWATKPEERTQLWQARHDAYFACLQIRPGSRAVSTDVCVPISRLAECVHETMEDVKNYFAPVPLLGHIGDGNFHLMLLVDPAKPEETEIAKTFNKRLVERALRMEGTCTGEHGVGLGKIGSMRLELGDDVIDVMRDIKKVFDPENLMNPGKVVPPP